MAREPHPPKKKHPNKPRPTPLPPLTDDERAAKAVQEFEKAIVHLIEAEKLAAWGEAPGACAHTAYYAMHHAARGAILAAGGVGRLMDAPPSHEHVIEHYGKLIASEPEPLASTGLYLTRARADRTVADYGLSAHITKSEAAETVGFARLMVDAIRARWDFSTVS